MVHSCCIVGCAQRQDKEKGISLHRIPTYPDERKKQWINSIRRQTKDGQPWTPSESARVCSLHFLQGKPSEDNTHPDYIPNQRLPGYKHRQTNDKSLERHQRASKRRRNDLNDSACDINTRAEAEDVAQILLDLSTKETPKQMITQGTQTGEDEKLKIIEELQRKLSAQVETNIFLRSKIKKLETEVLKLKFGYNNLSDKEVNFYTSLTPQLFLWVLQKVSTMVKAVVKTISMQDHLLLVLMKLRLGLLNKDLAFRFNVSETTVSRILHQWIPQLAECLKCLIIWPENDVTRSNVPESFKPNYKKVVSTIDCFEVFTERPHNLTARAQTWSNYKHNNTVKYLVSITPSGAVNFISSGWGGRVSDKEITLKSGYIDKLSHGDEVLADRGFLVSEELAAVGVTLRMPSFTRGKKQLSAQEVHMSKCLSNVRIHVERVIGKMRNFLILQSTIPVTQVSLLDDMVVIVAALTNLMPSVVPS